MKEMRDESLLGGACGGGRGGERRSRPPARARGLRRQDMSYAQAASSPPASSEPSSGVSEWRVVQRRRSPPHVVAAQPSPPPDSQPPPPSQTSSLKRRRSPESPSSCARCFRTGHSAAECRHLISCRRCGGAGHFVASCPGRASQPKSEAPRRRRVRSHKPSLPPVHCSSFRAISDPRTAPCCAPALPPRFSTSIPVTKEILKAKDDLKNLAVISVFAGNVCRDALANELPAVLGAPPGQQVSTFLDHHLVVSLPSVK